MTIRVHNCFFLSGDNDSSQALSVRLIVQMITSFSAKMRVEISEIECERIVKKASKHENVVVVNFELENFGNYFGFLGEYFRLKIDANVNDLSEEFNFFVKSLPVTDLKQRKMLVESGIFKKEVKLYEDLLLNLSELSTKENFWCPRGYLFRDDLLVLDNMALKGYKMLPFHFKFDKQHVEKTLKSLASFHCSSIIYEEINGKNSIVDEFGKLLFETSATDILWYHAGLKVKDFLSLQFVALLTFNLFTGCLRYRAPENKIWQNAQRLDQRKFLRENLRVNRKHGEYNERHSQSSFTSRCLEKQYYVQVR